MVTVASMFLKLSVFGKAKEGKAVSLKKKKVKKPESDEEEEEEVTKKRRVVITPQPKRRVKRKKKKLMTSDFGGIRHPKYRVKQDDEPLAGTSNFGGMNQPKYPVTAGGKKTNGAIRNSKGFHAPSRS
jgi:hypothetical protein